MRNVLRNLGDSLFRRKASQLTIPILDGALKPNDLIEQAPVLAERAGLEDLALGGDGELYAACGDAVLRVASGGALAPVASFDAPVTALAALADGTLAVATGTAVTAGVTAGAADGRRVLESCDGQPLACVSAVHARPDGSLLVCEGSATRPYRQWSHDLLEKGRTGRLLEWDPASGRARTLARGLAWAFGALVDERGRALVSESWRHRVCAVEGETLRPVVANLPGYPARMAAAPGGGFWLTLFASRTQLFEFVLLEDDYREDMMRTVDPRYWVAPAMSSGEDFLEPLQSGGVKQMGILKPWAPPRSYGLVVRVGADFLPKYSLHSRVGGRNHGIVAVAQRGDELFVLSKGAGRILRLSAASVGEGAGA